MPKSLTQVNALIAKLQREADALKSKERHGVIARIREAIDQYGLTATDLGFRKRRSGSVGEASDSARKKAMKSAVKRRPAGVGKPAGAVKFRNGDGRTWTGHGRPPGWFTAALEGGATRESLLVK